jgi:hypothetical protein
MVDVDSDEYGEEGDRMSPEARDAALLEAVKAGDY